MGGHKTVTMSIAVSQPRHIFGLKATVSGNIAYHDEQTLVYPSGANCILYNIDQKSQKFIPGSDKSEGMTAMAVSPNRRYVAIAEKGEKATITIYDLHSLRKRKILSSNEVQSTEYVSLAFSPDSKYLVAQGGRPDWTLLYWTWEKSKVMASTKTTNPQTNPPIHQVNKYCAKRKIKYYTERKINANQFVYKYEQNLCSIQILII